MRWQLLSDKIPADLEELEQIILDNRNIENKHEFLKACDPLELKLSDVGIDEVEFRKAVKRIQKAQKNQESIIIFGDYDADGICATAILWRVLFDFGCKVTPFIPDRTKHGYGINVSVLKEIESTSGLPDLIITVDNGIVATEAFDFLKSKNVDTILTDHHQPESKDGKVIYPRASFVVHTTKLCGATVSWMLAKGVSHDLAMRELDLCAIATIADQVPLLEANRSFVIAGLSALKNTLRPGLNSLFKKSKIDKAKINASTIGFIISPKINAMGRLAQGIDALRLLCTRNQQKADELSKLLMATNQERQELTNGLLESAIDQAKRQIEARERIIIVSSTEFHEGIIGLIAGRLSEQFSRPAIAMSIAEGTIKASARSLRGINIVEMIREVKSDLLEVGGHPLAAGFGLEIKKLETVKTRLFKLAKLSISEEQLVPLLELDCILPVDFLTAETYLKIQKLEPFGQSNPRPVFQIRNLKILDVSGIGNGSAHLKITLQAVVPITALWWRHGDQVAEYSEGSFIDIAGEIDVNFWKGKSRIQILVKDISKN